MGRLTGDDGTVTGKRRVNGVSYLLRDLPVKMWTIVRASAALEGITVKEFVLKSLDEKISRENLQKKLATLERRIDGMDGGGGRGRGRE